MLARTRAGKHCNSLPVQAKHSTPKFPTVGLLTSRLCGIKAYKVNQIQKRIVRVRVMKNCSTFEVYFISVVHRGKHFFNQSEKFSYMDINKIGLFDPNNRNSRLYC